MNCNGAAHYWHDRTFRTTDILEQGIVKEIIILLTQVSQAQISVGGRRRVTKLPVRHENKHKSSEPAYAIRETIL